MSILVARWKNASRAPFAAALAMAAILSGVRGLVDPASLPLHDVMGDLSYGWAVIYGLGGFFMLYGASAAKSRYEALGAVWFACGAGIQAVATAVYIGRSPFLSVWSVVTLALFSAAGVLRAVHLSKGQTLIWVEGRLSSGA